MPIKPNKTPAQNAGLSVGDKIVVYRNDHTYVKSGDIITLVRDDNTFAPAFKGSDSKNIYFSLDYPNPDGGIAWLRITDEAKTTTIKSKQDHDKDRIFYLINAITQNTEKQYVDELKTLLEANLK